MLLLTCRVFEFDPTYRAAVVVFQPTFETYLVESMAARQLCTYLVAIFILSLPHLFEADVAFSVFIFV